MKKSAYVLLFLLVLVIVGVYNYWFRMTITAPVVVTTIATSTPTLINTVHYTCQNEQTIVAEFYETKLMATTSTEKPSVPPGSVHITMSDGRTLDLAQTISADGGRYTTTDESFVFWSKGNGLTLYENSKGEDQVTCIAVSAPVAGVSLPSAYISQAAVFSLRLPSIGTTSTDYTADDSYTNQISKTLISTGVKFTIPASVATGTNLSSDSYLSVEQINASSCTASLFSDSFGTSSNMTDTDVIYSVATSSEAGAGNRYEETVYALPNSTPCLAIRYFIHYTAIENYPTCTIKTFDKTALVSIFDHIRRSLLTN